MARPAGFTQNLSKINSSPYGRLAGVLRATRWSNRQSLRAHQSDQYKKPANSRLCILARPAGLEPATSGLEGRCSIQLSYERIVGGSQLYRLADSGVYFTSIKRTHHCVSWDSYARLRRPVLYRSTITDRCGSPFAQSCRFGHASSHPVALRAPCCWRLVGSAS